MNCNHGFDDASRCAQCRATNATRVTAKYAVCARGVLGVFAQSPQGWRFLPWVQHQPSRKAWPTAEAALPRWARDSRIIEAESPANAMTVYAQRAGRPL